MKRLWAVILALCTGCAESVSQPAKVPDGSHPVSITLHGDTLFTPSERTQLESAANAWENATNGLAHISLVWDYKHNDQCDTQNCVIRYTSDDLEVLVEDVQACGGEPCVLGWVDEIGAFKSGHPSVAHFIADRDNSKGYDLTAIATHEFGHLLGAVHIPYRWAIMYPSANPDQKKCITQADITDFCTANVCGTHKMFPCD